MFRPLSRNWGGTRFWLFFELTSVAAVECAGRLVAEEFERTAKSTTSK